MIFANFMGFGFALLLYVISQWYLKLREKKKEGLMQYNFLSLIKEEIDEILFNSTM